MPGLVVYNFNPVIREAEVGRFLNSRPIWSMEGVPEQPGLKTKATTNKTKGNIICLGCIPSTRNWDRRVTTNSRLPSATRQSSTWKTNKLINSSFQPIDCGFWLITVFGPVSYFILAPAGFHDDVGVKGCDFFFFAKLIALLLNDCSYLHLIESSLAFRKILRWIRIPSKFAWVSSVCKLNCLDSKCPDNYSNMVGLT